MKKRITAIVLALILVFATVGLTTAGSNTIIYVDDDNISGPWDGTVDYPFQYIQDGINASSNGDTVFVNAGSYDENIRIHQSIHLQGEDKKTTEILGDSKDDVVDIDADNVSISGFSIYQQEDSFSSILFGIFIYDNSNICIEDNMICSCHQGIAIRFGSNITIHQNTITKNKNGAVNGIWSDKLIIKDNYFSNNSAGLSIDHSTQLFIHNNIFFREGIVLFPDNRNDALDFSIKNNTANDQPITVYKNHHKPNDFSKNCSQLILINCSNQSINSFEFSNVDCPIQLLFSDNNTISHTQSTRNLVHMYLIHSNQNHLYNNTCISAKNGILLSGCSNNVIEYNTVKSASFSGIALAESKCNTIQYNSLMNNSFSQLIDPFNAAIYLFVSNDNAICYNDICYNKLGINIESSSHNLITKNTFYQNLRHAKFLGISTNNKWHNNYWNQPRILPKPIFDGIEVHFPYPRVNVDWHPAAQPYTL